MVVLNEATVDNPDMDLYKYSTKADFSNALPASKYSLDTANQLSLAKYELVSCRINSVWSKAIKTSILKGSILPKYSRLMHGEDLLQCALAIDVVDTCVFLDEPLYWYRTNASSITHSFKEKQVCDLDVVTDALMEIVKGWGGSYLEVMRRSLLKPYCGLILLLISSRLSNKERERCREAIRESLLERFEEEELSSKNLDLYHSIVINAAVSASPNSLLTLLMVGVSKIWASR